MDLTDQQIIAFFKENFPSIKFDPPNLRDIKRETVEECLIAMLSVIYGLEDNFFANDEYEPKRRLVVLVSLMQRTVEDLYKDFDMVFNTSDLIAPQTSRIRTFLGILINFYKFVCQQTTFVDSVFEEVNNFEQKQIEVQQSIDNLQSICDRELELIEQDGNAIEELMEVQTSATAEFVKLTAMKEQLKTEALRFEELMSAQKTTITELEYTVNELKIESENLNDEIIQSPEQLFADIAHCETELKETRESTSHFKRQRREQDRLKHEAEVLREKCDAAHAENAAIIKANLDKVNKCRDELAESEALLKRKQNLVLAMERDHNEFRTQCENEIRTTQDSIKVLEVKIQNVLRQNETYLQNAVELENYDFAAEEKLKNEQLKQVRDQTAQLVEESEEYLTRCLNKENHLEDRISDATNQYGHLVKFVDKCVTNVQSHPTVVEIQKAMDMISELENKKMILKQKIPN